ncbi:MAG: TonB C-terminal domain-containing protein [Deltaproteobacteria bacterium]|nr:TonB C-terminal domain-containing protein [Deltaproteobacteria bacterium]
MNPGNGFFNRTLLGSSLVHLLFLGFLLILPTGEPGTSVTVYTVRIMEAPSRPQVSDISPLETLLLEAPNLDPDRPQPPDSNGAPEMTLALPAQPALGEAPKAPVTAPLAAPGGLPEPVATPVPALPSAPKTPSVGERAPAPPDMNTLPSLPPTLATPPPPVQNTKPGLPPGSLQPPPVPRESGPGASSTLERVRERVRGLELRVEPATSAANPLTGPAQREQSLLALRLYTNRVREAVKENYSFPGGFPPELRTRVRVVLNRDGTVKEARMQQSSGNERFDTLVCLASIHKARFPHVPVEVEGEAIPFNITCTP